MVTVSVEAIVVAVSLIAVAFLAARFDGFYAGRRSLLRDLDPERRPR